MHRFALIAAVLALTISASAGRAQGVIERLIVDPVRGEQPRAASVAHESVTCFECPASPPWWVRGEYVFWAIGTGKLVEIAKEAYNSNLFNALLDAAGKDWGDVSRTLLGNDRTGFRFELGGWLDEAQTMGVEAGFLYLNRGQPLVLPLGRRDAAVLDRLIEDRSLVIDPSLRGKIDRPLFALLLLRRIGLPAIDESQRQIVIPFGARNLADGQVTFEIAEQTFWVLDLLGRMPLESGDGFRVDGLLGYRRVYYEDNLAVRSDAITLSRPLFPGTQLTSFDRIRTENAYDGALFGLDISAQTGAWTFAVRPTATIAYLNADVIRTGATIVTFPDRSRIGFAGGTYLRGEDLGTFSANEWTVIPEISLRATRAITENIHLSFGTSLVYLPRAARAAPQLDIGLDPDRTLPGTTGTTQSRDVVPPELRSVFLSTLSVGLEIRY